MWEKKTTTTTNQSQATGFDFGVLFENLQTKICPSKEIILAENNFVLKKGNNNKKANNRVLLWEFCLKICTQKFDLIDIVKIGGSLRF